MNSFQIAKGGGDFSVESISNGFFPKSVSALSFGFLSEKSE